MKFLAAACALTTTAHAKKLAMCGQVDVQIYKDSDCKTLDKTATEENASQNFAISCYFDKTLSSYVKFQCNTEYLLQEEYAESDCTGTKKRATQVEWGACNTFLGSSDANTKWATYKAAQYL